MRFLLKILFAVVLLLVAGKLEAQDAIKSAEEIIADIYEQISEESETEIDFTNFFDDLMALSENPINLNSTNKEELDKLQFLSDTQVDNILYYLYKSAPMQTIYELQLIEGLDMTDIRRMLPFVSLGESQARKQPLNLNEMLRYGKNELYFRLDKGLETKEGYRFVPEEENAADENESRKYVGDPYYNHLKYRFRYKDRVQFGVTAEKDAGEQFWGEHHKGYDFFSAHLELRNVGKIKTLVLGDFRANFGQGLVMRTDFSMGKSSYVMQVTPKSNGLKKFSSTSETDFLRGAGATFRFGKVDVTAFYSNRMIDGDTLNGQFSGINESGLHRTLSDLQKKNTVNQQIAGANIVYTHSWFQVGTTAIFNHFSQSLQPRDAIYNRFYFRGQNQLAASVNYRLRWQKLNIFGETALTDQRAMATINGVNFSPLSRVSLVALHRYFSKEYDALFANTFSETSRVNNESGMYLGTEIRPVKYWKVSAYVDSYSFSWNKFGVDAPSTGEDYLLQVDYFPKRNVNMYWRFRHETKAHNFSDTLSILPVVLQQPRWQARYQLNYSFGHFDFKNQLDVNGFDDGKNKPTYGFSVFQDVSYDFQKIPLGVNARFHVFDAQDFENRFYTYEKDVLYAFSVPMNYGMGTRYYLNLRYDAGKKLSLWLKLAQTVYADDRTTVSSGNEEITGNRKTDMRFLMRWKF